MQEIIIRIITAAVALILFAACLYLLFIGLKSETDDR